MAIGSKWWAWTGIASIRFASAVSWNPGLSLVYTAPSFDAGGTMPMKAATRPAAYSDSAELAIRPAIG
jgi:hypothetical protein